MKNNVKNIVTAVGRSVCVKSFKIWNKMIRIVGEYTIFTGFVSWLAVKQENKLGSKQTKTELSLELNYTIWSTSWCTEDVRPSLVMV